MDSLNLVPLSAILNGSNVQQVDQSSHEQDPDLNQDDDENFQDQEFHYEQEDDDPINHKPDIDAIFKANYTTFIVQKNDAYLLNETLRAIFIAAAKGDIKTIEAYYKANGNISIRDNQNRSLLQLSMLQNNFDECLPKFLLEKDIDLTGTVDIYHMFDPEKYDPNAPDPKDAMGRFTGDVPLIMRATVLHLAYFRKGAHSDIFCRLLKDKRIDVNATCDDGPGISRFEKTIYPQIFNERKDLELSAYEHDALLEIPTEDDLIEVDTRRLSYRRYLDGYALEEASLVHYMIYDGNIEALRLLFEGDKLNINQTANLVRNKHLLLGREADIIGTTHDNFGIDGVATYFICRTPIVSFRIFGVTALHLAFRKADKIMMRELVAHQARMQQRDQLGNFPADYLAMTMFENACLHIYNNNIFNVDQYKAMARLLKNLSNNNWPVYQRLILGDGNFSFALAFANKHTAIARSLIATDFQSHAELRVKHRQAFTNNIIKLKQVGVEVKFNVDARNISAFRNQRFPRIHFNCPSDGSGRDAGTLPKLIFEFFQSAGNLQKQGDRIYMSFPEDPDRNRQKLREGYIYNIFESSARNGYIRAHKRLFRAPNTTRYPEYEHVKTNSGAKNIPISETEYEQVFIKTDWTYAQILNSKYKPGIYKTRYQGKSCSFHYLKEIPIEHDSSDEEILKSFSSDEEFQATAQVGSQVLARQYNNFLGTTDNSNSNSNKTLFPNHLFSNLSPK